MKKVKINLAFLLVLLFLTGLTTQAQAQKKWSPQAKGTVIGAGAGALGGALINKRNRAAGGVVGGVVGGAAGYAIGKHKDNKNKEAARVAAANRAAAAKQATARPATSQAAAPAALAYRGGAGQQPVMVSNSSSAPAGAGFLLNTTYGDASTPYPTSEYRRKSW